MKLEQECGVTQISLKNAKKLVQRYGLPAFIHLFYDKKDWTCVQIVWTDHPAISHIFTGFSWGYGGEGPRGLKKLFDLLKIDIGMGQISQWDAEKTNLIIHKTQVIICS